MSENFLVSESLKGSLSRETLYHKEHIDNCPIVFELRVNIENIELDVMFSMPNLKHNILLNDFIIDERKYTFSEPIEFNLNRIYRNKENLLLSTIITNDKDFWRKLQ